MNDLDKNLISCFNENKSTNFFNKFWGINYNKKDVDNLNKFSKFLLLKNKGLSLKEISNRININYSTLLKWSSNKARPPTIKVLEYSLNLENFKDKWLSINSTKGGSFTGPWISVPNKITNYDDLLKVINQLNPLKNINYLKFDLKYKENLKPLFFSYILGMMIGDASKTGIKRSRRITRRIQLRLTTRHKSNENVGEFLKLCLESLGLKVNRGKDCPTGKRNTHPFYAWHSQCSPLIEWIFNVCLGLNNEEKTTYNAVKIDWILDTTKDFKIWFLQGLSDSDGFIDITTYKAGIITGPNTKIIQKIFDSLNIKSSKGCLHHGTLDYVTIKLDEANKLPLFNPHVKLYRYKLMKKIMNVKRLHHHWSKEFGDEIDNYLKLEYSSTKIIKSILNKYNILIRQGGIWKRRCKINKMIKKDFTCLGIESTALQ